MTKLKSANANIIRSRIFYTLFALFTVFSLVYVSVRIEAEPLLKEKIYPIVLSGEYSIDGGKTYRCFDTYDDIDMRHIRNIIVRGYSDRDIKRGEDIYLFMDYVDATVKVDDLVVYQSKQDVKYCWDAVQSLGVGPHDMITVELSARSRVLYNVAFRQFFDKMCTGSKAAILTSELRSHILQIVGELIILALGMSVIIYMIEMRRAGIKNNEETRGYAIGGIGIMCSALTCFVDAEYITLLIPRFALIEYIDSLTQIFSVIFIIVYLRRYLVSEKYRRLSKPVIACAYILVLAYMFTRMISGQVMTRTLLAISGPGVLILFIVIYMLGRDFKNQTDKNSRYVVYTAILLTVGIIFEVLYFLITGTYIIKVLELCMFIFAFTQFYLVVTENVSKRKEAARAKELENELMQSRINIMMSQIQPHFLYNALGTIRALCTKNPDEARNAMDFFAKYLRANMESLDRTECIPFKKEMEHVESYLYIEKLRFGDLLNIEYDIDTVDFTIPAMTVQTLAENAVKHGLLAKEEGGTLRIVTREADSYYEVRIIDDGVGFDTTAKRDDSRTHVGIENSRKRLAGMCRGTLAIGSRIGEGTTITICIPKGEKNEGYIG